MPPKPPAPPNPAPVPAPKPPKPPKEGSVAVVLAPEAVLPNEPSAALGPKEKAGRGGGAEDPVVVEAAAVNRPGLFQSKAALPLLSLPAEVEVEVEVDAGGRAKLKPVRPAPVVPRLKAGAAVEVEAAGAGAGAVEKGPATPVGDCGLLLPLQDDENPLNKGGALIAAVLVVVVADVDVEAGAGVDAGGGIDAFEIISPPVAMDSCFPPYFSFISDAYVM
jgi:hypothetical protein